MQIWAIGGGKGGTGKSFVASGLGVCLAERGFRVILVDADFGGANLHTYLGLLKPQHTFAEFVQDGAPLKDLTIETPVEGLSLIAGDLNASNSNSLNYNSRRRFFRQLRQLDADYVLMDLGAGSHHKTIDAFLEADRMLAVTVPERMAIENLYVFIKSAFFRKLHRMFKQAGILETAKDVWKNRGGYGIRSMAEFTAYLCRTSSEFNRMFLSEREAFKAYIVLNKVRDFRQIETGHAIRSMTEKFLGIPAAFVGHVRYDRDFWDNLAQETICLNRVTAPRVLVDLTRIADGLTSASVRKI